MRREWGAWLMIAGLAFLSLATSVLLAIGVPWHLASPLGLAITAVYEFHV